MVPVDSAEEGVGAHFLDTVVAETLMGVLGVKKRGSEGLLEEGADEAARLQRKHGRLNDWLARDAGEDGLCGSERGTSPPPWSR